jgi:DNA-binding MarR family transcriptional regulator
MIISLLYVLESANFLFLKRQIPKSGEKTITDGNLSAHLSKLEEAGYVNIEKKIKGKKTETILSLTKEGREAFDEYRKKMSKLLGGISEK